MSLFPNETNQFKQAKQAKRLNSQVRLAPQQGVVAIATAIVLPVLVLFIGLALTYSYALIQQSQLGNAAESAAIFLAQRQATDNQRDLPSAQAVIRQFNGLRPTNLSQLNLTRADGDYRLLTSQTMPSFGNQALAKNLQVSNQGAATGQKSGRFDIALIVDLSGSQAGSTGYTKYQINQVVSEIQKNFSSGNVRLGLLPFSAYVAVENVDWLPASQNRIRCVSAMSYYRDANGQLQPHLPDIPDDIFRDYQTLLHIENIDKANAYLGECPDIAAVPLTTDLNKIRDRINQHQRADSHYTAIHHSVVFGARMLADNWLAAWQAGTEVREGSRKAMVFIGDASDSSGIPGTNESPSGDFSRLMLFDFCETIKRQGIAMYSLRIGDYEHGANLDRCINDNSHIRDLADFPTLMTEILADAGVTNGQQRVKLVR
ncbi:pilus assembly protein [Thalassotalea euphylliae]|uniref:Pilus assembly protein n=1 Tax=Thalassotalea euphylliae TaxID=1655234 RepID=A0A3E0TN79_9GAMM|nr:TadE/TadG family type IV pilus assembly protein [Thalassotalea euphylliae]REL25958.1 pilus assembly protein [Thalassotalea euphylliae]